MLPNILCYPLIINYSMVPGPTFVGHRGTCAQAHNFSCLASRHIWPQVTSTSWLKLYQVKLMLYHLSKLYILTFAIFRTSIRHFDQIDSVLSWSEFVATSNRLFSLFSYIMTIVFAEPSNLNKKNLQALIVVLNT